MNAREILLVIVIITFVLAALLIRIGFQTGRL